MKKKTKSKKSKSKDIEKEIIESLKHNKPKEINSDLEQEAAEKQNNFDNVFIENVRTEHIIPTMQPERRVRENESLEDITTASRTTIAEPRENIQYTTINQQYTGEEYQANLQKERQALAENMVRKIQTSPTQDFKDLLVKDSRITENPIRPRLMERQNTRTVQIEEDYKNYESSLPFQTDKKKYKARI